MSEQPDWTQPDEREYRSFFQTEKSCTIYVEVERVNNVVTVSTHFEIDLRRARNQQGEQHTYHYDKREFDPVVQVYETNYHAADAFRSTCIALNMVRGEKNLPDYMGLKGDWIRFIAKQEAERNRVNPERRDVKDPKKGRDNR